MNEFRTIFRAFPAQLLHILTVPLFFYVFCLTYRPHGMEMFLSMGKLGYTFHLTMLSCILLAAMVPSRIALHYVKDYVSEKGSYEFDLPNYLFWCFLEQLFAAMFMGLYIWLFKKPDGGYFEYVVWSLLLGGSSCVFPYAIIYLAFTSYSRGHRHLSADGEEKDRLRFHDEKNNLKFVVSARAVLYITAEENYVRIYYLDGVREKEYLLRNTMKSIIDLCSQGGLVRCHRSYYVNPQHVKILGKDSDGIMHAIMDDSKASSVPVSKRYYEELLAKL